MTAFQNTLGENGLDTYSDAASHVLQTQEIPENCCGTIEYDVRARRVSDGASKVFLLSVGFKRVTGDVTTFGVNLLGSIGTTGDLIALATVAANVQGNGTAVELVVSGIAATEIDWGCITAGKYLQHTEE